jgi:cell division protein FtsW (lipid II flippase)
MVSIIVEVSKYLLLFFMLMFTWGVFRALGASDEEARARRLRGQMAWMMLFNLVGFFVLYIQTFDIVVVGMYVCVVLYLIITQILFHVFYSNASFILVNVMSMLLSIGFLIQTRFNTANAMKQLIIAAGATVISMFIPVVIRKWRGLQNFGVPCAIIGILLVGAVFAFAQVYSGGKLSVEIGGISFQFSEFVKITFVLFIASMLREITTFGQVMKVTVLAGLHVIILVLSTDLGAALIYFMAYIVMVCVATRKIRYAFLGIGGMAVSAYAAYRLFSHVRVRVSVWRNPFEDYQGMGYQIVQALFSICAGGWFGTGLLRGSPESIPLVTEDCIFAAICEEMGILFGICLIALCMGLYLVIVNIAMKLGNQFYKMVAIGLGTEYAFQVFLTIGGQTKFIPMTGVTLPLISYGGSSVMCTIFMLAIVQGLYVLRKDETDQYEEERYEEQLREREQQFSGIQEQSVPGSGGSDTDDLEKRIEEETEKSLYW